MMHNQRRYSARLAANGWPCIGGAMDGGVISQTDMGHLLEEAEAKAIVS